MFRSVKRFRLELWQPLKRQRHMPVRGVLKGFFSTTETFGSGFPRHLPYGAPVHVSRGNEPVDWALTGVAAGCNRTGAIKRQCYRSSADGPKAASRGGGRFGLFATLQENLWAKRSGGSTFRLVTHLEADQGRS